MKTILIVDDDIVLLKQFEKEIHRQLNNIKLLTASNYKDSVKYILNNKIDVAIIDIYLPDVKEGVVIDFALKKNIPTMIITGDNTQETQSKFIQLPIIEFIQKKSAKSITHAVKTLARILKNHDTNILIVDDSLLQIEQAKQILENMQLNITTAINGKEALDILENSGKKFSLVLTDYNMPVMDGMELTLRIREKYDKDELGIIVMSVVDSPDVPIMFIKYGANDFVNKPFTLLEMSTRINSNLEILDLFKSNSEKESQILIQAKNAQIGELIGNIAHQWRQPLSVISTAASGMKLQKEISDLPDEDFYLMISKILSSTKFLSNTIDTFRDYISDDNIKTKVNLQNILNGTIDIVASLLKNNQIKLINNIDKYEDIYIITIKNELSQTILNILYNAKDILVERDIKDAWVKIDLTMKHSKVIVSIEDNGGGIADEIINKIFDPYFTTKHQSQGTGLGLYMCKEIVTKQLNGNIYVNNGEEGAIFLIELPLA